MKPHRSRLTRSKMTGYKRGRSGASILVITLTGIVILTGCMVYIQRGVNLVSPPSDTSLGIPGATPIQEDVDWLKPPPTQHAQLVIPTAPIESKAQLSVLRTTPIVPMTRHVQTPKAEADDLSRHVMNVAITPPVRCQTTDTWFLPLRERNMGVTAGFGSYDRQSTYFKTLDAVGGLKKEAQGVYHPGMDFRSGLNAPVFAVADSKVESVGYSDQYGTHITLLLVGAGNPDQASRADSSHSAARQVIYGHLADTFVTAGQFVKCGQVLALTGATGKAIKGAHLHFEVREAGQPVNPLPFIQRARVAAMPSGLSDGKGP